MKRPDRKSLRFRISLAFGVTCASLALGFALFTHISFQAIGPFFAEAVLAEEFDRFIDGEGEPEAAGTVATWSGADHPPATLDDLLPILGNGHHLVETPEGFFEIGVDSEDGQRYAVALENDVVADRERIAGGWLTLFILLAVASSGAFGFWWGARLSDLILAPLQNLAGRVAALPEQPEAQALAPSFGSDEVGDLAHAFDEHRSRLSQFIEREQSFVADASHELRNGVSVITSSVEVLLDSAAEPTQRQRLIRLLAAARRLRDLAHILLTLARESDLRLLPEPEPLRGLLEDLVQERRPRAQRLGKTIELRAGTEAQTRVPPEVVATVVGNLLDNAVTHADRSVIVSIDGDGLRVDDDGPGLPDETLSAVFKRGVRGARAADGGFGLGLSIVRRLCERYGWSVRLENLPKAGARARIDGLSKAQRLTL